METFNTVILIYGKIVRNALRNIFRGAMDFKTPRWERSQLQMLI